jgi:CarD family transcriptional regulator
MKAPAGEQTPNKQSAPKAAAKTAQAKPMATARKTETKAEARKDEAAAVLAEAPEAAAKPAAPRPKAAAARTATSSRSEAPPMPEAESAPLRPGLAEAQAASPSMSSNSAEPVIQAPIRPAPPPKPLGNAGKDFKAGDFVVYPTHGVGQVQGIEEVPVAGVTLKVIVVTFEENRMTLKVPMAKAASSGLRKLASEKVMGEALETLRGRARIKRTMWSRRAQEYEQKINSGDPIAIAEVVRDLHRNAGQPDQSFSERQIYELALDRLAAEVAALDRTDKAAATQKLLDHLKTAEKAEKTDKEK